MIGKAHPLSRATLNHANHMKREGARSALLAGRRFVLVFGAVFGILLLGFWSADLLSPGIVAPLTGSNAAYIIVQSFVVALTFGGLYAAASILRS